MKKHTYWKMAMVLLLLVAGSALAVTLSLDSPARFPIDI
jgi:hypothetical protein